MAQIANMARIPELRKRIFFALGLLAVYRLGVQVPTPGIDAVALKQFFDQQANTILGVLNLFSGGALERFSIFALGIMPYISASIIFQLLTVVFPYLEKLNKEGEQGRKKIQQYSRYLTIVLAVVQGFGIATFLQSQSAGGNSLVLEPGLWFKIQTVITLTSGTAFLMWLGEQITERGIGNGISLIIFAGIVAGFPRAMGNTFELVRANQMSPLFLLVLVAFMLVVTYFIVFFEQAQRRIPVQYAKRVVGRKMMQGQSTYLPLKINMAGVIPPIFASSLLTFPATVASFSQAAWVQKMSDSLSYGGWIFNTIQVVMIVFFCYFYTAVQFNPDDVADNMKKYGGYVPGIRPGKNTSHYIEKVLERLTLAGGVYLAVICTVPVLLQTKGGVSFYFGGTSLLIVVGVALDTMAQIESHLMNHHYDGFLSAKSSRKLKARKG
ncbi:MAG: preprotein translocase subunit SecY [Deltaproteobacteria bacterium]|nr:preprotein translocase subunit SecY [Deltaproteobacteria bacterium]